MIQFLYIMGKIKVKNRQKLLHYFNIVVDITKLEAKMVRLVASPDEQSLG